jgi:hypothetical protein
VKDSIDWPKYWTSSIQYEDSRAALRNGIEDQENQGLLHNSVNVGISKPAITGVKCDDLERALSYNIIQTHKTIERVEKECEQKI